MGKRKIATEPAMGPEIMEVSIEVPVKSSLGTIGGKEIVFIGEADEYGWIEVRDSEMTTYKLRRNENGELVS